MEGASTLPKHRSQHIENVHVPKPKVVFVKIVCAVDANIYVTGKYSGREYLFSGAGSIQDVDQIDVEWILEKRQGERQCCGGSGGGNQVFYLAGE